MTREQLNEVYLDWFNNYITIECYADHNGLHIDEAHSLINLARGIHLKAHPDY
jgi:hypothetical protein